MQPAGNSDVNALVAQQDNVGLATVRNSEVNALLDRVDSLSKADALKMYNAMGFRGSPKDPHAAVREQIIDHRASSLRVRLGGHPMTDTPTSRATMEAERRHMNDEPLQDRTKKAPPGGRTEAAVP